MNKITINDKINIRDSFESFKPVGIITVYDKDGNVIARTHNMIVEEGRRMLMSLLFQYGTSILDTTSTGELQDSSDFLVPSDSSYPMFKFAKLYSICYAWSDNPIITNTDMKLDDIGYEDCVTGESSGLFTERLIGDRGTNSTTIKFDPYLKSISLQNVLTGSNLDDSTVNAMKKFNEIYITFKADVPNDDVDYSEVTESSKKEIYLFSRAVIDPIYFNSDTRVTIEYVLHF